MGKVEVKAGKTGKEREKQAQKRRNEYMKKAWMQDFPK